MAAIDRYPSMRAIHIVAISGIAILVLELIVPDLIIRDSEPPQVLTSRVVSGVSQGSSGPHLIVAIGTRAWSKSPKVASMEGRQIAATYDFPTLTIDQLEIPIEKVGVTLEPILKTYSYPVLVIDLNASASIGKITELLEQLNKIKVDGSVHLIFVER